MGVNGQKTRHQIDHRMVNIKYEKLTTATKVSREADTQSDYYIHGHE